MLQYFPLRCRLHHLSFPWMIGVTLSTGLTWLWTVWFFKCCCTVSPSPLPCATLLNIHCQGLYTGIVTVTLWVICMSTSIPDGIRRSVKPSVKILLPGGYAVLYTFLCTIVIMLYFLSTIAFGSSWTFGHWGFIEHGNTGTDSWWGISFPTCAISRNSYKRMQVGLAELPK